MMLSSNSRLRIRPTREQIASLPPFMGLSGDQVILLSTPTQFDDAWRAIERERFVGFDTESKPTFTKNAPQTGPHVLQFALPDRAFIVQTGEKPAAFLLAFLASVLASDAIVKVGFGLDSDRAALRHRFGITMGGTIDLAQALRVLRYKEALGAKAAVAIVLGQRLQKSKSVTTSNWAAPVLKPNQLLYAANDAFAALEVHRAFLVESERLRSS